MRNVNVYPLLTASLLLGGCQSWGPTWSEVTGSRYHKTEMNRAATIIERIDDSGAAAGGRPPYRIDPGNRVLIVQAVPLEPMWGGGYLKEFAFVAEPCKRYYVNAQYRGRLVPSDWEPVIDEVEALGGCTVPTK